MASSHAEHDFPRASLIEHAIGRAFLGVAGWRIEGQLPKGVTQGVMIAAPHTTNWDMPYMLATAYVYRLRLNFLGKHTLFEGMWGPVMRWLGGIPVDRRASHGLVGQVVQRFAEQKGMLLAIAPAGTRSRAPHWKSGFYHIAHEAQIPILCGFLDFRRKVAGVGPAIVPTGDVKADMDRIRAFYADKTGKRPEATTPMRLESELDTATTLPLDSAAPAE